MLTGNGFRTDVLIKGVEEEGDQWLMYGPVASLKEDYDGEILEKSGILNGLKTFFRLGRHIDYDHQYTESLKKGKPDPDLIIGQALEVRDIEGVPNLVVRLFKSNPIAQKLVRNMKDGMEAGFSIFGFAKKKVGNRVRDTEIHMVTIAPSPKGFDARLTLGAPAAGGVMALAKALASGPMPLPDEEEDPEMPQDGPEPGDVQGGQQQANKIEVNYRPGEGMQVCANCMHFLDGTCEIVKGPIRPQDTCDAYEAMEQPDEMPGGPPKMGGEAMPPPPGGMPPMGKAVSAHGKCEKCGGKTYCLNCHRSSVEKAYTTGSDVVTPTNAGGPTDSTALRKQQLEGADEPKKKRKRKKQVEKSLSERLRDRGITDPDALRRVMRKISVIQKSHSGAAH